MSQSERSRRYAATEKGKAAAARKYERQREKRQAKSHARKKQTQEELRAQFDAAVLAGQEWARLHPKPTQAELIANPEKYGAVQTAGFDNAVSRFVQHDLENIFPQLASLPEIVKGKKLSWQERASYELHFLSEYIFTVWENRHIPSTLLIPIFDGFKLSYMKHLRDRVDSHCCTGQISECGYGYESDGEAVRSHGTWQEACQKCRQYAWAELTTEMVLTVCAL